MSSLVKTFPTLFGTRLKKPERVDGNEKTPLRSAAIALQTEGAEVFYRDIELREIAEMPAKYAAKKQVVCCRARTWRTLER
jgi:hypothetical protein